MHKNYKFSCYLIGEDSLLIQCAEILLDQGHSILGIVSPLTIVRDWSNTKNIPYFVSLSKANEHIHSSEFDYLFSIVNSQLLSDSLLNKANKFSINYHDSPLPRYAGVNATCWAILNQEKSHAITWHIMNNIVDAGDILKQVAFDINEDETALSLNLKCYKHAIKSFSELTAELSKETYNLNPQNLNDRTYYGYNEKPPGNAWLCWNNSAEDIERLFRALSLGNYTDRFSLVKMKLDNEIYIIAGISISNIQIKKTTRNTD